VGKFLAGGIMFTALDRGLIKGRNRPRYVNAEPVSEKEETERMADSEDKEVFLCTTV
jgi:hypothetical protein